MFTRGSRIPHHHLWLTSLTILLLSAVSLAAWTSTASAQTPRVLPDGETPNDRRLGPLKDLNGYFPFSPPATRQAWDERADSLRQRILVATGLWPMPEKTPLNPVIHSRADREDFSVEKVYFESHPDHFVTGLLFRPKGKAGRLPGVLCPHGHGGRLQDYGEEAIRRLIVQGAERFEGSGRFPKLARCAQLARMGCVVFIFDMIGYADSVQIPRSVAHSFSEQRPEMDTKTSWGFFSTQAELRLQSIMGLQTWNSVRALDFLCGLPDVDPARIGVTGGSGGGTQTILLCAIDPRPVVAFPQGMVSTSMQGGCTCENCSLLRVGTGNVELAALYAPKPQAMTTADDWTKEMMTKGYPQLQQLYGLLGAKDNVLCRSLLHFPHNYNYVTRALMYSWFNTHLGLGLEEPIVEEDFRPLTPNEWTVWNDQHPRPEGGEAYECSLTKYMDDQSHRQISQLAPRDAASLARYREIVGGALDTIIGRSLPERHEIERGDVDKQERGDYVQYTGMIRMVTHEEALPTVLLYPNALPWNGQTVIWIDGQGKAGLFEKAGDPRPEIGRLLADGSAVLSADLLYLGEFLAHDQALTETRVVSNPRQFAGYTFGYNHTLFAQRVHDILTLIALARDEAWQVREVHLVGLNGAGPWVAAAAAQAGEAINRVAVDTQGFRFTDLTSYRDVNFLPGAVKYGDLPALLALCAGHDMWLAGEHGRIPDIVSAAFEASGRRARLQSFPGQRDRLPAAAAEWLLNTTDPDS